MKTDASSTDARLRYLRRVGRNIAYYRKEKEWIQEDLAQKSNLSRGYISRIEAPTGRTNYSMSTLLDIALALQIDPSKLFEKR